MTHKVIPDIFNEYVKNSKEKAIVVNKKVFLCNLTNCVFREMYFPSNKTYITTRAIKHMFDKKPAEEFIFLIENIHKIIKYPDKIYKNKNSKRGSFCFVKSIEKDDYICCIEITEEVVNEINTEEIQIVTSFRIRKQNYLDNYKLLWSWKDDKPSS